jgi:hypothetical protein
MGVYDKLLKKHYTPPQRQVQPQEKKSGENKKGDDATTRLQDDQTTRRPDDTPRRLPDDATMRRKIKRESMNFYEDQLKYLRDYSLQERIKGKQLGVSQMVRDAIDSYIEKIKEKK